jgi:hypothetical protein
MHSLKTKKLINLYAGLPRLIIENWQSIKELAQLDCTLYSFFHLWDLPETEECVSFLNRMQLPIHISISSYPSPMELARLCGIEIDLLNSFSPLATRSLYQFYGLKLAYENAKNIKICDQDLFETYYLRCRTDLYIDKVYGNAIIEQLRNQKSNEIVFPGATFGFGFLDTFWISGPTCSDIVFSMVDGFAELYSCKYVVCQEIGVKLYIDKKVIPFSINRKLPALVLRIKNSRLVKCGSAGRISRYLAWQPLNYATGKRYVDYESILVGIIESIKIIPVDLRISYCIWRRNRRIHRDHLNCA